MKIIHIPKDKVIKIRYESETEKEFFLKEMNAIGNMFGVKVEELKQTG